MIRTYIYVDMHIYILMYAEQACTSVIYTCPYTILQIAIFDHICIYLSIFVYIYDTCETASHAFLGNHPELGGGSKSTFTGGIKIHIILMWKPRGLDMFWPIAISPKTLLKRIGSVQKKLVGGKFAQKSGRRLRSWRKFLKRIQAVWAAGAPI